MIRFVYISHFLNELSPAYAGGYGIQLKKMKSLCNGDSCNQLQLSMSNHIGTHVDVPSHFIDGGKTVTDYSAEDWIFNRCCLIDIACQPGQIVDADELETHNVDSNCELLLIRTGFESFRDNDIYWKKSPVFHKNLGAYFESKFKSLKAICFDCISLSSMCDREMGRESHMAILGRGIRIFEDAKLSDFNGTPKNVFALPLMLENADGAQVTMVANVDE